MIRLLRISCRRRSGWGYDLSRQAPTRPYAHQAPHKLQPVNTDRWYYRVFQSAPDLIRSLLPGSAAANANTLGLDPDAPGDRLYRYCFAEALRL